MCVYCENIPSTSPASNSLGLNVIVTAITNRNTRFTLNANKNEKSDGNHVREAFEKGMKNFGKEVFGVSQGEFLSQPRHLAVVCITNDELSFLERITDELFLDSVGHAAGWVIAKGLKTTEPLQESEAYPDAQDRDSVLTSRFGPRGESYE